MQEKIVIVTGANSGIGKETALALAKMGATVVMVCRSQERGAAALADIKRSSGSDNVHLMLCDLGSQASIRRFTDQFKAQYDRLDVLVNNAGLMNSSRQETEDGIEMTFAVNHLALLGDMWPENTAQGFMHNMGCRVVAFCFFAVICADLEMRRVAH